MTQPATSSPLLAGFKNGLGEIVHLVSDASQKTGPWVASRIGKFSKKAQDEIYGRFNAAFNGGIRDAAKGREFLESSLDFVALTEKVTEVADDIEHADKIHKLFQKNAPIKTILDQYNTLSLAARKEIEKHLQTTAVQAKPQKLQEALVTVFGGMGRLESETTQLSASSSSSTTPSSTSAKPPQDALETKLLMHAKQLKNDVDLANSCKLLLEKGLVAVCNGQDATVEFSRQLLGMFDMLSPAAQFFIKKIVLTTNDPANNANAFELRKAILIYFNNYLSWSSKWDDLSKNWKLNGTEAIDGYIYLQAAADFSTLLPAYGIDNKTADEVFERQAKALLPKIDVAKYNVRGQSNQQNN